MKKIYRCLKCGWHKEVELYNDIQCPRCEELLTVEINDKEDDIILKMIEEDELEYMKWEINIEGSAKKWHDIETIKNHFTRIEERKLFIKAGGIIPLKEIKI